MSDTLTLLFNPLRPGLSVTLDILDFGGNVVSGGLSVAESGASSIYTVNVPSSLVEGVYIARYMVSGVMFAQTAFDWTGVELRSSGTDPQEIYDKFVENTNADAFKADLTPVNTAITALPATIEVVFNDEADGVTTIANIASAVAAQTAANAITHWQGVTGSYP